MNALSGRAELEEIITRFDCTARIEAPLPIVTRRLQPSDRILPAGMLLSQADQRPAHLTCVYHALTSLLETDQAWLGVITR